MNKEEIDEIDKLEIDFNDIDELNLALEVSSKKSIYLIDDLTKDLFELQKENKHLNEQLDVALKDYDDAITRIDNAIELIDKYDVSEDNFIYDVKQILRGDNND